MYRLTSDDANINFLSVDRCFISYCGTVSHPHHRTLANNFMDVVTDNKILPCKIKPIIYLSVIKQVYERPKDTDVTYLLRVS
jgi:hypothetical protein